MGRVSEKKIKAALNETDLITKINGLLEEHGIGSLAINAIEFRSKKKRICNNGSEAIYVQTGPLTYKAWCPEDGPFPG